MAHCARMVPGHHRSKEYCNLLAPDVHLARHQAPVFWPGSEPLTQEGGSCEDQTAAILRGAGKARNVESRQHVAWPARARQRPRAC